MSRDAIRYVLSESKIEGDELAVLLVIAQHADDDGYAEIHDDVLDADVDRMLPLLRPIVERRHDPDATDRAVAILQALES